MPSSPSDSSRLPANRKEEAPEELRKSVLPKYVHGTCSHARPCANSCKLLPARPLQLKLSWNARRAEMAVEQHDGSSPAFENVNMSTSGNKREKCTSCALPYSLVQSEASVTQGSGWVLWGTDQSLHPQ